MKLLYIYSKQRNSSITFYSLFLFLAKASSEHPLAKAIMEYARQFHFFDEHSATKDSPKHNKETNSGWLFDVLEFSTLPGKGVQCFIDGKLLLVSFLYIEICKCQFIL